MGQPEKTTFPQYHAQQGDKQVTEWDDPSTNIANSGEKPMIHIDSCLDWGRESWDSPYRTDDHLGDMLRPRFAM